MAFSRQLQPEYDEFEGEEGDEHFITLDDAEQIEEIGDIGDMPMDEDEDDMGGEEQEGRFEEEGDEEEEAGPSKFYRADEPDSSFVQFSEHHDSIYAVSLHPTLPIVCSGGGDDLAYIWSLETGEIEGRLEGHKDSVTAVQWSNDGEYVATGGMDGRVAVWKVKPGTGAGGSKRQWELAVSFEEFEEVQWLDWHPKGSILAAGAGDGTVFMWQLPQGRLMNIFTGHLGPVTSGRFTPDGKHLFSASSAPESSLTTVILHNPRFPTPKITLSSSSSPNLLLEGGVTSMSINSKGTLVALGGATGGVRIISIALSDDGESGEMKVVAALEGHVPNPSSSSTSTTQPATNFQPIPSLPGASAPLNPNATQEMDEDQEAFSVESCAFVSLTKGGQEVVVTAATDGRVLVWEPQAGWKGREAAKVEGAVTGILPHPIPSSSTSTPHNSTHLLTFSTASRLIHTIDLRTSSPLGLYQGSRDVVHCLDVSRDGKWVVGGGDDGVVRGWMVDPGLASSTLPRPSVAGR